MKPLLLATAAVLGILMPARADALTITNNDPVKQSITVIEGDSASTLELAPGETGERPCRSGCVIRMANGDEYDFEGVEAVVIEGDVLYLEDVPPGDPGPQAPDTGENL